MRPLLVFLLCLVFDSSLLYVLDTSDNLQKVNGLTYPKKYHFKGELIILSSPLKKTFELWSNTNNIRVDYYGGVTKYYIIGKHNNKKAKYYIYPKTTETKMNEIVCTAYDFDENSKMNILLPEIKYFYYSGQEIYNNTKVEVWKREKNNKIYKIEKTVYLRKILKGVLPVWYEVKVYNDSTGQMTDHLTVNYYDFKRPREEDLNIKKVKKCEKVTELKGNEALAMDDTFLSYRTQHNKSYMEDEYEMRKRIFQENLRRVVEHNRKNSSYKMAMNLFSDRTDDELAYLSGTESFDSSPSDLSPFPYSDEEVEQLVRNLTENYNMRTKGFISNVKNQFSCGSCWAFAATATVEGALALKKRGRRLLDLSEQSLIDCSWGFSNKGCKTGYISNAFSYIKKHGIPTESAYGPYLEEDGFCNRKNISKYYYIKKHVKVNNINEIKVALHEFGPVAALINSKTILYYSSGIFYEEYGNNKESLDHGVTIVGYGVEGNNKYWIVKNSWGENWGENGYARISTTYNEILSFAYYVVV